MFEFLGNPYLIIIIIFMIFTFLLSFFLIYMRKPIKRVLYFNEADLTFKDLKIKEETPRRLITSQKKITYRFFRNKRAYNGTVDMQHKTLYLGKRGTAYTQSLENKDIKNVKLYDALETIWGTELMNQLKPEYRDMLMNSEILVTIELEQGLTPEGFSVVTERELTEEANETFANLVAHGVKGFLGKRDYILIIFAMLGGMTILFILNALKILKLN